MENAEDDINVVQKTKENNDENSEEVLSWEDIVHINESLEREAEALLGGQKDNVCTYPEGYKFRQPLYSCKTCSNETGQQAGVCYACSFNCHDGHDLVELYTKRKFCCDCGNSKFKTKCKLFEEKCEVNKLNKYNDNFNQIYCVCKQIYPVTDPEKEVEEMHQCCICEDWFHLSHIYFEADESKILERFQNDIEENWEMVCKGCVEKLPFLMFYGIKYGNHFNSDLSVKNNETNKNLTESPNVSNLEPSSSCKLSSFKGDEMKPTSIYFLDKTWRENLCHCSKCLNLYEDNECTFLLEEEDTMYYYDLERRRNMELQGELPQDISNSENLGEKKSTNNMANSIYNLVVKKTNNRDAALDAYLGVQEMYKHMGEYFKNVGNDKVITRKDVEHCFEELQAKRARFSNDENS